MIIVVNMTSYYRKKLDFFFFLAQGHVDGTGEILDRWTEGESLWMKVAVSGQNMAQYIVPKGFICIDGTSLTICDVFYG
jgi:riboflavin synthase